MSSHFRDMLESTRQLKAGIRTRRWGIPLGPATRLIALLFVLTAPSSSALAVLPDPAASFSGEAADEGAPDKPGSKPLEDQILTLQEKLKDARLELASTKAHTETQTALQPGAEPDDLAERNRLLRDIARSFEQHVDTLQRLQEIRGSSRDLKTESDTWKGFADPPPYSIDMVDDLRVQIAEAHGQIQSTSFEKSLVDGSLGEAHASLKQTAQALRQANEQLQNAGEGPEISRLRWVRDLMNLRDRYAQANAAALESKRKVIEETLRYHQQTMNLLKRKLEVAIAGAPFVKEDLDRKLDAIAVERASVTKEIRSAEKTDVAAQEALQKARERLQEFRSQVTADEGGTGPQVEKAEELQAALETSRVLAESANEMVEGLRLLKDATHAEQTMWEERFGLAHDPSQKLIDDSQERIDQGLGKLSNWQTYLSSKLDLARSLVGNQQKRLADWQPGEGDKGLEKQLLRSYQDREALYRRLLLKLEQVEQLLQRWQEEVEQRRRTIPIQEQLQSLVAGWTEALKDVWNYELFTAKDTITVEGQEITGEVGITLSKVIQVTLILVIGVWLARRVATWFRGLMTARFNAHPSVATLAYRGLLAAFFLVLVVFAMTTVKIPLTVFAFLGGALAIGVGFGAKNLINNFISGIILLLERPIKVGDMVEVENVRGQVENIGARYSRVRRFDGIDILVPNSSFLEKDVTNWTIKDTHYRLSVSVGVSYDTSTRTAAQLITRAVEEHGRVFKDPHPIVLFEDFGDSALLFTAYCWMDVRSSMDYRITASDIRHKIKKLFDEAGISIAFPQHDVHLDATAPIQVQISSPQVDPTSK